MAKPDPIEQKFAALTAIKTDPKSETAKSELTKALASKSNLLVAKAATIITESQQANFLPQLATAFTRFFTDSPDKGCTAKTAIANALYTVGHHPGRRISARHSSHPERSRLWPPHRCCRRAARALCPGAGPHGLPRCAAGIGRASDGPRIPNPRDGCPRDCLHRFPRRSAPAPHESFGR